MQQDIVRYIITLKWNETLNITYLDISTILSTKFKCKGRWKVSIQYVAMNFCHMSYKQNYILRVRFITVLSQENN